MDGMAADDASPASAVRERYERMFREQQRGSKGVAQGGDPAAAALTAQGQAVRTAFQGGISSVFTKHLRQATCYQLQYKQLALHRCCPDHLSGP